MIQDGIYYQGGKPSAFRLVQLNFHDGITPQDAKNSLALIWEMLTDLTEGKVSDLRKELRATDPDVILSTGELKVLLGYGARMFDPEFHSPILTEPSNKPRRLIYLRNNNENTPYSKLTWSNHRNPRISPSHELTTQSDFSIQLTGNTELTVNRPIVELEKLIRDHGLPVTITNFHRGFGREDKRSWIDFHDGINNMTHEERKIALEITGVDRDWLIGGTYLSFLKIHVNLDVWRKLSREQQEFVVGRDKITACPITGSEEVDGGNKANPTFQNGCPISFDLSGGGVSFFNPPQPGDDLAQASHIFRANLNRGSPSLEANNRIYRQGYEFLEFDPDVGLLHGLNFVGFHRSIKFLSDILSQNFWMGDVNFGGLEDSYADPVKLMELLNGAYYAVPPKKGNFPGEELFE